MNTPGKSKIRGVPLPDPGVNPDAARKQEQPRHGSQSDPQKRLDLAKDSKRNAHFIGQRVSSDVLGVTRRIYKQLIAEGQGFLDEAKNKYSEAQQALKAAQGTRADVDQYRERILSQVEARAGDMVKEARVSATEAYEGIKLAAMTELEQARLIRASAETYSDKILLDASNRAEHIEAAAHSSAHMDARDILRRAALEAEAIRAAAREEYKTMKLYAEAARVDAATHDEAAQSQKRGGVARHNEVPEALASGECNDRPPAHNTLLGTRELSGVGETSFVSPSVEINHKKGDVQGFDEEASQRKRPEILPETPQNHGPSAAPDMPDVTDGVLEDEMVLGVTVGVLAKAYPTRIIAIERLINDHLGGKDILITLGPPSDTGVIFDRAVNSGILTFQPWPDESDELVLMKDLETGTVWEALTGYAVSGPLLGSAMDRIPGESVRMSHWQVSNPQTVVYAPASLGPQVGAELDLDDPEY